LLFQTGVPEVAVDRSVELLDRLIAANSSGIVIIADFEETARLPPTQIMRSLSSQLARRAARIVVGTTVLEGTSASSMAKRTAVAMMTTVLKPPYPHRVLGTVDAACAYVVSKAVDDEGAALGLGALVEALTALKAPRSTGL